MQTTEKLSITLPAEMVRDQRLAMLDTAITKGIADAESGRT